MILLSNEFPQQKINVRHERKLARQPGQTALVCGMFFALFLMVMLLTQLQLDLYRASSQYLEDALAASNLAAAVIDLAEYGRHHTITIDAPDKALVRFETAIKGNLNLNEEWECPNEHLISGKVEIEKFILYNVDGNSVSIWELQTGGEFRISAGKTGEVFAPDGQQINHTSIYSEISFMVEGLLGMPQRAQKGKLIDVVTSI